MENRASMIITLAIQAVVLGVCVGLVLLLQPDEYPRWFAFLTAVAVACFATWGPLAILDAPDL